MSKQQPASKVNGKTREAKPNGKAVPAATPAVVEQPATPAPAPVPAADAPSVKVVPLKKKPTEAEPIAEVESIELSREALKAALLCVGDQSRANLCGVHLRVRDKRLEMVSTDGVMMLVQILDVKQFPSWAENDGITFDAPRLDAVVRVASKTEGPVILSYADKLNMARVEIGVGGWATIRVPELDAEFPDYVKIIEQCGETLAGGESAPLATDGAMSPENQKRVGVITAALDADACMVHLSRNEGPNVYTFGDKVHAVLYAMPMRVKEQAVSGAIARLLSPAMQKSVAALKGHIGLFERKLKETSDKKKRAEIEDKIAGLNERLALCSITKQLDFKAQNNKPTSAK